MTIKKTSLLLALLYAIIVGVVMMHAGKPESIEWLLRVLPIWVWAIGHMFLFVLFIAKFRAQAAKISLLICQIISFIWAVYAYYDAFYVQIDAQNALILIFLPVWQYFLVLGAAIIIKITQSIFRWFNARS